jgi:hypothetical protein
LIPYLFIAYVYQKLKKPHIVGMVRVLPIFQLLKIIMSDTLGKPRVSHECNIVECNIVYKKVIYGNTHYLVTMEKLKDTKTNEHRKDVTDNRYATFRANKLKVLSINKINLALCEPDTSMINQCVSLYNPLGNFWNYYYPDTLKDIETIRTIYKIGEIVYADRYDEDAYSICTHGIHYFRSKERAIMYDVLSYNIKSHYQLFDDNGDVIKV